MIAIGEGTKVGWVGGLLRDIGSVSVEASGYHKFERERSPEEASNLYYSLNKERGIKSEKRRREGRY